MITVYATTRVAPSESVGDPTDHVSQPLHHPLKLIQFLILGGFAIDLRFINHSDEPNAAYYDTLEVCALTDIAPGEEITHDYLSG